MWNDKTGELVQAYRIKGNSVQVKLHDAGTYSVKIGEGERWNEIKGFVTKSDENKEKIVVEISS